jgi:hypothetical protein
MNRRKLLASSVAFAAAPFADGQTVLIGGAEFFLTDIVGPKAGEPAGDFAAATLRAILAKASAVGEPARRDRWGRPFGRAGIFVAGRETSLQEVLLAQGAARVFPQSDDFDFIERCYRAEDTARAARLGLWSEDAYRVRDAGSAAKAFGFAIYDGVVRNANDRGQRVFLNFGDDYRSDFTATIMRASFRRWRGKPEIASFIERRVEIRGIVDWINGPSIELRHEMQLRTAPA